MWHSPPTTSQRASQQVDDVELRLRRESDLVHLCARGARIPTIRNLVGQVSDSKIKDVNRRFHGERKGAKTRGLEYYMETPARRRDASFILGLYRRIADAHLPMVQMYVTLHNMYMRERTVDPAFDIDELIRLTCAVDMGSLKVERCHACGAHIVMQPNEINVDKCCFVCHPLPVSKTRVRVSTAEPITFPSDEQIQSVVDELTADLKTAIQLVRLGARPQEVDIFVPGQEAYARKLWPVLLGSSARQGPHPFTSLYYIEKIERRRHAAFVIKTFRRLKDAGLLGAELFIALHRSYLGVFDGSAEMMHFARIRSIVHFWHQNELKLVRCPCCNASYVILADELPGDQTCPSCRLAADARRAMPAVTVSRADEPEARILPPLPGDLKRRRQPKKPGEKPGFSTAS